MIAWDGSHGAARAVVDALPMLTDMDIPILLAH